MPLHLEPPDPRPTPSEPEPDSRSSTTERVAGDGSHLDELDDQAGADEAAGGVLTREQFRQAFGAVFSLAGSVTGLRTLLAAPGRPEAGPAADAVYDIAAESPWLRWLIEPQGVWLQRALAIGMFAVPLAAGVSAELRERQAPPAPEGWSARAAE